MDAAINSVDHGEGFPGQLVMHSLADEAPGNLRPVLLTIDHIVGDRPLDPLLRQGAMHDGHGRPAKAKVAKGLLRPLGDDPARGSFRRGKPPSFQPLQAANHQPAQLGVGPGGR